MYKSVKSWAPILAPKNNWVFVALLVLVFCVSTTTSGNAQTVERKWGLGWDDGLTLRCWISGVWEIGIAAGPNDYLTKEESRRWFVADPIGVNGLLEVPNDGTEEHGWVRLQIGRLIKKQDTLALVGYAGLTHEWIDFEKGAFTLNTLAGDYDTFETDRFTGIWMLSAGLRPSWRPTDFLTIEMAFGLQFVWESWDQETHSRTAGVDGFNIQKRSGHDRSFSDYGWNGVSSLQFIFWL